MQLVSSIFVLVRHLILNVISAYAPQVGLSESIKMQFWEDLDSMVSIVPTSEKLFIGGDLNGHVGATNVGFERVHGGFLGMVAGVKRGRMC